MELVASREVTGHAVDVECRQDGGVFILTKTNEQTLLQAFNAELAEIFCRRINGLSLMKASNGTVWLLEPTGATALDSERDRKNHVRANVPQEMRLAGFATLDDGFIFVCEHDTRSLMCAPVVSRADLDGKVRWSTTLPVETLSHRGIVQMSKEEDWRPRPIDPWIPRTWLAGSVTVSEDAVLAEFNDKWGSGIATGYVLSVGDGLLRFVTRYGPIGEVAPLGAGTFLVGFQGYGEFETLHYGRLGEVKGRWPSQGHYVVTGDIRVIEMKNMLPSTMHLVRLLDDGTVVKGDWLDGYYTSAPYCRADGTLFFWRHGALLAARDLSIDDRLDLCTLGDSYSTKIVANGRSMYFALHESPGKAQLVRVDF